MSSVSSEPSIRPVDRVSPFAYPLIGLILIYRATLSPLIGQSCRFWPTCSHYTEESLRKYGAWRGSIMGVKRLLRCHPWHDGGYDPVP